MERATVRTSETPKKTFIFVVQNRFVETQRKVSPDMPAIQEISLKLPGDTLGICVSHSPFNNESLFGKLGWGYHGAVTRRDMEKAGCSDTNTPEEFVAEWGQRMGSESYRFIPCIEKS